MQIIGLTGPAGAGKRTVAKHISAAYGYVVTGFATLRLAPGFFGPGAVATDITTPEQAAWIRERGILIHLERALAPAPVSPIPFSTAHGDMLIKNNHTIEDLYEIIDVLMARKAA